MRLDIEFTIGKDIESLKNQIEEIMKQYCINGEIVRCIGSGYNIYMSTKEFGKLMHAFGKEGLTNFLDFVTIKPGYYTDQICISLVNEMEDA